MTIWRMPHYDVSNCRCPKQIQHRRLMQGLLRVFAEALASLGFRFFVRCPLGQTPYRKFARTDAKTHTARSLVFVREHAAVFHHKGHILLH